MGDLTDSGPRRLPRPGWAAVPPVVMTLAAAAIQVLGTTLAARGQPDRRSLDLLAYVLLCLGPLALPALRRRPIWALAGVLAVTLGYLVAGYPYGPVFLSMVVALVATSVLGHREAAITAAAALLAGHFVLPRLLDLDRAPSVGETFAAAAWLLVVLLAAEGLRFRRAQRAEAARSREEAALRRASEERLGMARELHDVLAHSISLINVQASTALHLIDDQPERAAPALAAIKKASSEALGEVRSVLGALRQAGEEAPRSPAVGLDRLEELVASTSVAGLEVSTRTVGTLRRLPAGVDAAAFRIVQEALTNVTRHAGESRAAVTIAYAERELTVSVEDDGRAPPSGAEVGNGLRGMRERAEALGGSLEAGPMPSGGFRVLARLPTGAGARREVETAG